jgi:putative oxidoreductase
MTTTHVTGAFGTAGTTTARHAAGGALHKLLETDADIGTLVLRLTLAVVFFPHGAQKVLGWFGGPGFAGELDILTGMVGLPAPVAVLVILIEFFGAIALAVGLLGRLAALGIAAVMAGAVLTVHLQMGFFMNWFGEMPAGVEGFEYHLLAIGISVVLMIKGSGAFSLDRACSGD